VEGKRGGGGPLTVVPGTERNTSSKREAEKKNSRSDNGQQKTDMGNFPSQWAFKTRTNYV